MEIPDYRIENLLRHIKTVVEGYDNPTTKVVDNVRLLKQDLAYLNRRMQGAQVPGPSIPEEKMR